MWHSKPIINMLSSTVLFELCILFGEGAEKGGKQGHQKVELL